MKFCPIGPSDLQASVIGLGTWAMGGDGWGGTDENEVIAAIRASLDAGINLIDTAPIYGFGLSEELVARAIAGRRDQVILATKCGLVWNEARGDFFFPSPHGPVHRYLGAASVFREVEESLRRLKTDYLDLYQTHWQETTTPVEETMAALLQLQQQGKIRAIGVSNVEVGQLQRYLSVGPVASVQELYSMVDREQEAALLPFCRKQHLAFLAYSPIAMGLLTGKIKPGQKFADGDMRNTSKRFAPEVVAAVNAFLVEIAPIARQHGLTLAQLAINWTLHQPGVTHVLCGARSPGQARENATACAPELPSADLDFISSRLKHHALQVPKAFA
jgi:aryl-alcohol dehydrogenase-like predicted oxidoreductase